MYSQSVEEGSLVITHSYVKVPGPKFVGGVKVGELVPTVVGVPGLVCHH